MTAAVHSDPPLTPTYLRRLMEDAIDAAFGEEAVLHGTLDLAARDLVVAAVGLMGIAEAARLRVELDTLTATAAGGGA